MVKLELTVPKDYTDFEKQPYCIKLLCEVKITKNVFDKSLRYICGCSQLTEDVIVSDCRSSLAMFFAPFYALGAMSCKTINDYMICIKLYEPISGHIVYGKAGLKSTTKSHAIDLYNWYIDQILPTLLGSSMVKLVEITEGTFNDHDFDEEYVSLDDLYMLTRNANLIYITDDDISRKMELSNLEYLNEIVPDVFQDLYRKKLISESTMNSCIKGFRSQCDIDTLKSSVPEWYAILLDYKETIAKSFFYPELTPDDFSFYVLSK